MRTEVKTERIPVGHTMYRDPQTGYVCTKASARGAQDCPVQLDPAHNRPMTDAEQFGFGGARKLVQRITGAAQAVETGAQLLTDPAKLSTLAEHTKEGARHAADAAVAAARDPNKAKEAASDFIAGAAKGAQQKLHDFRELPRGKQVEVAGGVLLNGALDVLGGAVVGGAVRTGETAAEVVEDAVRLAKATAKQGRKEAVAGTTERINEAGTRRLLNDARVQRMQPDPRASGGHTTFMTDQRTKKVYKYQEWDQNGMPVRRADVGKNSSHPDPHTHHPASENHMHIYAPPNKAPDGRMFPGKESTVRELEPHEIPR